MFESVVIPMGIYGLGFVISLGIAILINGMLKITQLVGVKEENTK